MSLDQFVGSSASNSHHFVAINTKRFTRLDADGNTIMVFRFFVDGICLKEMVFSTNRRGNADELISSRTKLKRIKSLI